MDNNVARVKINMTIHPGAPKETKFVRCMNDFSVHINIYTSRKQSFHIETLTIWPR